MSSQARKILFIDLGEKTADVKSYENYGRYIGGVGLGAKILTELKQDDSVIFSVGPLTGFFPCVSKTSVLFKYEDELNEWYLGGSLASRIKFAGLDSVVIYGKSRDPINIEIIDEEVSFEVKENENLESLGLPGKRSTISVQGEQLLVDQYFEAPEDYLYKMLNEKNVKHISITGTKTFDIKKEEKYKELYYKLLGRCNELSAGEDGDPSCFMCPVGCGQAKVGEEDGNVFIHSLVSCSYTEDIYSDVNTVFSCLDVLGYDYQHEGLENFPNVVYDLIEELNGK